MGELEIFAAKIKELREQLKMTQKEFSNYIGIRQQTLSGYERGVMKPPLDVAKNIAEKCNISLDWLCGINVDKNELKIKTYSDLFSLIIKIADTHSLLWHVDSEHCGNGLPLASLYSYDYEIARFFNEWKQLRTLYTNKTIDEHLYILWLKDKLEYYQDMVIDPDKISNK